MVSFFGNCSYNISLPLYCFIQTSFRAELRAVLAALLACSLPLWITSDCLGVVNLLKAINEDHGTVLPTSDNDLWILVKDNITSRPCDTLRFSWMRSHLKGQALSAELALGNVTQREVDANAEVDTLASNGAQAHSLTFEDVALQSETVSLAVLVHQMQLNLLTIRRQKVGGC